MRDELSRGFGLLLPPRLWPPAEQCIVETARAAAAGAAALGSQGGELSDVLTVPTRGGGAQHLPSNLRLSVSLSLSA